MDSKGQMFFAGVGTTFVILAMGFGGGIFIANSALHESPNSKPTAVEQSAAIRVVMPAAEQTMVQVTPAAAKTAPTVAPPEQILPQATLTKIDDEQLAETNIQNEMARQKKLALASKRASQLRAEEAAIKRRQKYAQRMAQRKLAQLKQQLELQSDTNRREPAVLAFGSDDRPTESGFFGN